MSKERDNLQILPTTDDPRLDGGPMEFQVRYNANAALEYLNKQEGGQEYELVEPGPVYGATISRGPILHFNFLAKLKDRPDAQVETFFAQLRMYTGLVIDLCVSLGPSEALPHWGNADVTGCRYCGRLVHHPREKCEKLLWGVMGEDTYWLYELPGRVIKLPVPRAKTCVRAMMPAL
ncbi:hypothetical protein KSS87_012335 [Heliosperma pusillum]|nr:hypothetical protein KSS87_012335 [Heliosperma pusillum]